MWPLPCCNLAFWHPSFSVPFLFCDCADSNNLFFNLHTRLKNVYMKTKASLKDGQQGKNGINIRICLLEVGMCLFVIAYGRPKVVTFVQN